MGKFVIHVCGFNSRNMGYPIITPYVYALVHANKACLVYG